MSLNSLLVHLLVLTIGIGAVTHAKTQLIDRATLETNESKSLVEGLMRGSNRSKRHRTGPVSSHLFLAI
jgi:hypothetical protein